MPRTRVQNVKRRGAVYWWTRQIRLGRLADPNLNPISFGLSLRTKDLSTARRRAVELTAFSERLRVSMMFKIEQEGLDEHYRKQIFVDELRSFRDWLVRADEGWQAEQRDGLSVSREANLSFLHSMWAGVAAEGREALTDPTFVSRHFPSRSSSDQDAIRGFFSEGLVGNALESDALSHLQTLGFEGRGAMVSDAEFEVASARARALKDVLKENRLDPDSLTVSRSEQEIAVAPRDMSEASPRSHWASLTPPEAADAFIADALDIPNHLKGGKRKKDVMSEGTQRDVRWACLLLAKNLPSGRAFSSVAQTDLLALDARFGELPISIGKSPWSRRSDVTLEMIREDAGQRVYDGDLDPEDIGLSAATTNKHWSNLRRVYEFLRKRDDSIEQLDFAVFRLPDDRDARDARQRMSIDQGLAIFSLPPWHGCDVEKRMKTGHAVIHDALYFAPALVWYTGARREEICKLTIHDVECHGNIPHLKITATDAGRVKSKSSKRRVPLHSELLRLGFLEFVREMRLAGETLLFPELYPATGTKRKLGDVFYKIWWVKIRPFVPDLIRGQAMHAVRHMVATELREADCALEDRNDLLGHSQNGLGEGAAVYADRRSLAGLAQLVECIPIVTGDVKARPIRNLGQEQRIGRPARKRKARKT